MAVHAQYLAHAFPFPHDHRGATNRPALDASTSAPVSTVFGQRKRARVEAGASLIMDLGVGGQHALLPPPVPVPQAFSPAGDVQMQTSRVLCSGAPSTSGCPAVAAPVSQFVLPRLYRTSTGVEIDALVRIESRASVEDQDEVSPPLTMHGITRGTGKCITPHWM
nr:unnamed protein product [Digitaria exilis]